MNIVYPRTKQSFAWTEPQLIFRLTFVYFNALSGKKFPQNSKSITKHTWKSIYQSRTHFWNWEKKNIWKISNTTNSQNIAKLKWIKSSETEHRHLLLSDDNVELYWIRNYYTLFTSLSNFMRCSLLSFVLVLATLCIERAREWKIETPVFT